MLINILIGLAVIGITVTIQGFGTGYWLDHIFKKYAHLSSDAFRKRSVRLLIMTAFFLLLINFAEASIWAITYYILPGINDFETFEKAMYFSLVTFTTLGYGDITISSDGRMLSGFEAINGILLIGWSTTLMFSVVQDILKRTNTRSRKS